MGANVVNCYVHFIIEVTNDDSVIFEERIQRIREWRTFSWEHIN